MIHIQEQDILSLSTRKHTQTSRRVYGTALTGQGRLFTSTYTTEVSSSFLPNALPKKGLLYVRDQCFKPTTSGDSNLVQPQMPDQLAITPSLKQNLTNV